jgi:hypothetical protein
MNQGSQINTTSSVSIADSEFVLTSLQAQLEFHSRQADGLKQTIDLVANNQSAATPSVAAPSANARAFWARRREASRDAPAAAASAADPAAVPAVELPEPKNGREVTTLAGLVFDNLRARDIGTLHESGQSFQNFPKQKLTEAEFKTMFGEKDMSKGGVNYSNEAHKKFCDVIATYARRGFGWDRKARVDGFPKLNQTHFVKFKYQLYKGEHYYYVWIVTHNKAVPIGAGGAASA